MGKISNLLNAKVSGNVGSMNFRRRGADTVVAERAYSNSSGGKGASEAQRLHRCRLGNVVGMFRAVQAIEAKAWEGKKPYVSDFNMLAKINLSSSGVFFTKEEVALNASVIYPYIMSRGSLTPLNQYYDGTSFVLGVYLGPGVDIMALTVAEFSARMIEYNEGWQMGDKLSFCGLRQQVNMISGVQVPQVAVYYFEVTLDANNPVRVYDLPNAGLLQPEIAGSNRFVLLDGCDAAFAIHSRRGGSELMTSEQRMIIRDPYNEVYRKYTSEVQRQLAMDSYGYQGEVLLTPYSEGQPATDDTPVVTAITLNDVAIVNGVTTTERGSLIVSGRNLNPDDVFLVCDGARWTPMSQSDSAMTYTVDKAGSFALYVNGSIVRAWTGTVPAAATAISSVSFQGNTYTGSKSGLMTFYKSGGTVDEPTVEIIGTSLVPVTTVGCDFAVSVNEDGRIVGTLAHGSHSESQYSISCNGVVALAGSWMYLMPADEFDS